MPRWLIREIWKAILASGKRRNARSRKRLLKPPPNSAGRGTRQPFSTRSSYWKKGPRKKYYYADPHRGEGERWEEMEIY